ncbi:hypothetical protein [Hyphomicrobium sp. 2TAF46]|uniref:hypothetical protein n=1 Tax=Hyphomicrobium sp. 2TAF46 TaxID=3233019 RepID=UPI003F8EE6D9
MRKFSGQMTGLTLALLAAAAFASAPADARECFKKYSLGSSPLGETHAKFLADESLLQQTDMGVFMVWMTGAGTPGYSFGPRKYRCSQDGVMSTCHAQATLCKL